MCNFYRTPVSCVGGVLASIEDPSEQQFITTHVTIFKDTYTSFWMGLYKTQKGTSTLYAYIWKVIFSYIKVKDYKKKR